jgi:glutamate---cysteine ligase / carboxylate-amine ligase
MPSSAPSLTLGIEEEYFLVEPETCALAAKADPAFLEEANKLLSGHMSVELFQSEFEVETGVCRSIAEARQELRGLRRAVIELAARHGLAPIAASSHPFSSWRHQRTTESERYRIMAEEYQTIARRSIVTGMHVHVGIADDEARIDLMNRVKPWLPLLLALSTSSPFWDGRDTGLKAIRGTVFGDFPRTGIPDRFESFAAWREFLALLGETELLPDPTKLWWDIRPSIRLPTLELRVADVCTRLEDALTIAALYQALIAWLAVSPRPPTTPPASERTLIAENKWRAQRSGIAATLGDFTSRTAVPVAELVERLVADLADHAARLGCLDEVENARRIVREGTSADRQRQIFTAALDDGASRHEALQAVVRWLIDTTAAGTSPSA